MKQQRSKTKLKLDSLQHPGTLMLLVDFLKVNDDLCGACIDDDFSYVDEVSRIVSILKVNYLNDIIPVAKENVHQVDLEDAIEEIKNEQK